MTVAILDVDGTLVDTDYQHALAWAGAVEVYESVAQLRAQLPQTLLGDA